MGYVIASVYLIILFPARIENTGGGGGRGVKEDMSLGKVADSPHFSGFRGLPDISYIHPSVLFKVTKQLDV